RIAAQVAVLRARTTDGIREIGLTNVLRVRIGFGIDGNRLDAQTSARPDDATGYFATVRNQDAREHAIPWAMPAVVCRGTQSGLPDLRAKRAGARSARRFSCRSDRCFAPEHSRVPAPGALLRAAPADRPWPASAAR